MSDAYADLRSLPLILLMPWLGLGTDWKERKGGTEYYGACPLHQAKTNKSSFSFHQDGRWHCFSCQAKGKGAIDFVMAFRALGFQEAVELLKTFNAASIPLPKPEVKQLQVVPTENEPVKFTYEKYPEDSPWLRERGLSEETLKHFGVFQYHNPNRKSVFAHKILLPILRFKDGACVGYLARNPAPAEGEPKYIFPKGVHKNLEVFGAWQIKNDVTQLPLRVAYVVESPFAVLKFHQLGLPAVSCYGWSVSEEQTNILCCLARGVVYLPDRNKWEEGRQVAGQLSQRLWVKMPALPIGVDDPEKLSLEQIRSL